MKYSTIKNGNLAKFYLLLIFLVFIELNLAKNVAIDLVQENCRFSFIGVVFIRMLLLYVSFSNDSVHQNQLTDRAAMNVQLMDPHRSREQVGSLEVLVVSLFSHRDLRQFWLFLYFLPFQLWDFLLFELFRSVSYGFKYLRIRPLIMQRQVMLLVKMQSRKGILTNESRSYL